MLFLCLYEGIFRIYTEGFQFSDGLIASIASFTALSDDIFPPDAVEAVGNDHLFCETVDELASVHGDNSIWVKGETHACIIERIALIFLE